MEENKQGYVDTPERIDAFQDAIWDSGLSMRAKIALHGICESPAQLKEVIDNDFTGRRFYGIGVKTKAEIRAFFDKFEKEHPSEAYKELSPREKMSYNLHRNIDELTDEEVNFILNYHDEKGHYPMFYIFTKVFEHTERYSFMVARDYMGICGVRRTHEQIKELYDISNDATRRGIDRSMRYVQEVAAQIARIIGDDWEAYADMFTTPIINPDDIVAPFEELKKAEKLTMDFDCFLHICGVSLGTMWMHEERGAIWLVTKDDTHLFCYDWMLRDLRAARRIKKNEFFDLSEYCRNPENWRGGKVKRNAVPTVIELCKRIVAHVLGLNAEGNKIILANKK